jgi:type IV fimbrial biogenesis protein FimT
MLRGEKQSGFTLIELMVVLSIAAIVLTLSTPLSNLFQNNRVSAQVREFVSALNLARGTAISQGMCTSLCISDGNNPPGCRATTNDDDIETWNQGWLVFTDADCDATLDGGTDTLVRQFDGLPTGYTLRVQSTNNGDGEDNDNRETITYRASGIANTSAGTWTLCGPSGQDIHKRGIDIAVSGRVRSLTVAEANNDANINLRACP